MADDKTPAQIKAENQQKAKYRATVQSQFEITTREWLKDKCSDLHRGFHELYPYQELCAQIQKDFVVNLLGKSPAEKAIRSKFEKTVKSHFVRFVQQFNERVKHPKDTKTKFPYDAYKEMIFSKFDIDIDDN